MTWHYPFVFVTGAVVLVLEILGTRLIAPFFGSTIYVWSAIITVTLASLALGYAVGGALADRRRPQASLTAMLVAAGLWLALLPWLRVAVLVRTSMLGVKLGALVSATLLFALPLGCLGAVGPLCVRLRTHALERLGREVGRLSAVSTAGSVVGALVAGYWLIPAAPVSRLLVVCSGVCFALAAFCLWRGRADAAAGLPKGAAATGLVAVLAVGLPASLGLVSERPAGEVRERTHGFYGELKVVERHGRRSLLVDGITNTEIDLETMESTSDYIRALELLPFFRPQARRALLVGLGGGVLVGTYARDYGIVTDVLDIDPEMLRIARDWFAFAPSGEVVLEDGRRFLAARDQRYDLIVVDAFNGDQHPYHLFSREAFELCAQRLAPGGLLAMNIIGYATGERAALRQSLEATLAAVFPHVRVLVANRGVDVDDSYVNLMFLAAADPIELGRDPNEGRPLIAAYYEAVKGQFSAAAPGGALISDDFNPIDSLSGPAFLAVRATLLRYRRNVLAY